MANKSMREAAEGRFEGYRIDPRKIKVQSGWNSRDFNDPTNIEHINELSISIEQIGVREPLKVFTDKQGDIWLTNGECRLRACMAAIARGAPIKDVPVLLEDRYANEADRLFTQITSNAGKPFTALEQARVFKRLVDMGWLAKDIASKAGISQARVSQVLNLLTLPEPVKAMVTNGQVSATMAVAVCNDHNPEQAVKVLQDAIAEASQQGRTKALPKDAQPANDAPTETLKGGKTVTIVKEAFEFSDVDNNEEDFVIIKMPMEHWNKIRTMLKL